MKKMILLFILVVTFSVNTSAQEAVAKVGTSSAKNKINAQVVIDNYITELGGKAKLLAIKTSIEENTLFLQNMEVTMVTKKMGNKFKTVQSIMGEVMTIVFDGEKGYFEKMGIKSDIPVDKISDLKQGVVIDALRYDASTFTSVSLEQLDGKNYYVLISGDSKFFFDAATSLLYKSETQNRTSTIKKYMTVDGIKFPEYIETEGNGEKVSIMTNKITLNSGVFDDDFKN